MPLFSDDLLEHLPAQSRVKIERLDSERDAAHAVVRQTSDALAEAQRDYSMALAEARRLHAMTPGAPDLEADYTAGKVPDPGPPPAGAFQRALAQERTARQEQAARLMEPVEVKRRDLERAQAAYDRAGEVWRAFAYLEPAQRWLQRMAGTGVSLDHSPLPPVKTETTAGLRQIVENIRKQLLALDDAWRAAEAAPSDPADYRARCVAEIEQLAERGALAVNLRNRGPNPLRLREQLSVTLNGYGDAEHTIYRLQGDPASFLCWLHKDALIARVSEMIATAPTDGALSYEAREKEFARISAERLRLEFQEESAICAAANAGMIIPRRRDCDPRAVLEVHEI